MSARNRCAWLVPMGPASLALLLAACGSSSPPPPSSPATAAVGSRGPRAADHLAVAQEHARRAAALIRWLDATGGPRALDVDPDHDLWFRTWNTARENERVVADHLDAATRIRREYDEACASISEADAAHSPLARYAVDHIPTTNGVLVLLAPEAGPADRLVAAMKCHRAWLMLGKQASPMGSCPLDLDGLEFVAFGDRAGISVELTVDDSSAVPELQRRVRDHLRHATAHEARR